VVPGQTPPKSLSSIPGYFSLDKGVNGVLDDFKLYNSGLFDMQFDGPNLVLTYFELKKKTGGKIYSQENDGKSVSKCIICGFAGLWNLEQGQQQSFSSATGTVVEK
jgi:hypothetical protein